jgi:hypothetical protein
MATAAIMEPTIPSHSLYGAVSGIRLSKVSRIASPMLCAVRDRLCEKILATIVEQSVARFE